MPLSESAIVRFSLAFAVFSAVTDTVSFVAWSDYNTLIKYAYTAVILSIIYVYLCKWATIDWSSIAPAMALGFFIVTGSVFVLNKTVYGTDVSYVSAFTAPLVFATALFIPAHAFTVDSKRLIEQLLIVFAIGIVFYMIESFIKTSGSTGAIVYSMEMDHVKSVVCVLGVCLCVLTGKRALAAFLLVLIAVALAARPTSTLVVSLAVCVPLAMALKARRLALGKWIAYPVLVAMIVSPLLFYYDFEGMSDATSVIEPFIKADVLQGESNTDFRLTIIKLALRPLDDSLLFGLKLSGNPNVPLGLVYPWWRDVIPGGVAMIHSDLIIILSQSGIVGYSLFAAFLFVMLKRRFQVLQGLRDGSAAPLVSLSLIAVVGYVMYGAFNPYLHMYHCNHIIWLVLFISEIVAKRERAIEPSHPPVREAAPLPSPYKAAA